MIRDIKSLAQKPKSPSFKSWSTRVEMKDPELILDWLDYSLDLKAQKRAEKSIGKAAKLLGRTNELQTKEQLLESLEMVSTETLRRSRARCDVVAMLLHRCLMSFYMNHELMLFALPFLLHLLRQ